MRDLGAVQDRYAGDVGDYLTLGLLRWLTSSDAESGPRLGVVWYRTVDEVHNADGKHIAYLSNDHASARRMRPLDPDLYDRLAAVVATGRRNTSALADAGVLPPTPCTSMKSSTFSSCPARHERRGQSCGSPGSSERSRRLPDATWSLPTPTTAFARYSILSASTRPGRSSTRTSTSLPPLPIEASPSWCITMPIVQLP